MNVKTDKAAIKNVSNLFRILTSTFWTCVYICENIPHILKESNESPSKNEGIMFHKYC